MACKADKLQRSALHIGAAVVVAAVPIGEIVAMASTPAEKLAALRAASNDGHVELTYQTSDRTLTPVDWSLAIDKWDKTVVEKEEKEQPPKKP